MDEGAKNGGEKKEEKKGKEQRNRRGATGGEIGGRGLENIGGRTAKKGRRVKGVRGFKGETTKDGNQPPYRRYGPDMEIQYRPRKPHGVAKPSRFLSQKGKPIWNSVSTPHRRYGHRLRTPFFWKTKSTVKLYGWLAF